MYSIIFVKIQFIISKPNISILNNRRLFRQTQQNTHYFLVHSAQPSHSPANLRTYLAVCMIPSMSASEKLCLKWNDFQANYSESLRDLRGDQEFSDVTLACDGDVQIEAHKIILSASSPFFRSILKKNKHPHPLIFLKGLRNALLVSILDFIYDGEVNISHEDLNEFLAAAEDLKVKGLSEENKLPTQYKPIEKVNEVLIPTIKRNIPKPMVVPHVQEYANTHAEIKLETYIEEEDYSVVEYEHEELQVASDYQKGEQGEQIENMIEKYEGGR